MRGRAESNLILQQSAYFHDFCCFYLAFPIPGKDHRIHPKPRHPLELSDLHFTTT
jgi:hypothetical protein